MSKKQKNSVFMTPRAAANGEKSWFRMKASGERSADIYIFDEIGYWGVSARQFASTLKALGELDHINLHIHSPGGDVFDGIAIYNLLNSHPASKTVYIDGLAASMASVIAMVGNPIIMPENAMMMIHYPSHCLMGTHEEPNLFINPLLIMNKIEKCFSWLFDCSLCCMSMCIAMCIAE